MKPLNYQERRSAVYKFVLLGIFSLLFIPFVLFLYRQVPASSPESLPPPNPLDAAVVAEIQQKLQLAALQQSSINLMVVVDATPGMENFIPAVADAIDTLRNVPHINITAACFTDASEGTWLYLDNKMADKNPSQWLRSRSTLSGDNPEEAEAVYYALKEALSTDQLKSRESNILFLIGDAGNHAQEEKTAVASEEIVTLLKEKKAHFGAFQVRHPSYDPAFGLFADQIRDEIMVPVVQSLGMTAMETQQEASGTTYFKQGSLHFQLYVPATDEALSATELTTRMITFADAIYQKVGKQVKAIQTLSEGKPIPEEQYQTLLPVLSAYGVTDQEVKYLQTAHQANGQKNISTKH